MKQETAKKTAYLKPELKEYGSVSELTRGATGTVFDNKNKKQPLIPGL